MALQRWNPYREIVSLRDAVNHMFDDSWFSPRWALEGDGERSSVFVPMDMTENDDMIMITAPLPGLKPEDVDISITGNMLTIKGEFCREDEGERENVHYRERRYGSFHRTVSLPSTVETDKVEATFDNGVLKLTLPKKEEAKPKQIEVKAKAA